MLMANFVLFQFQQGEVVVLTGVWIIRLASNTAFDNPFDLLSLGLWGNFSYQIQCSVHCHMDGQPTLFLSMSVNLLYFFLKASTLHTASKPNFVSSSPSIQLVQFDVPYVIDFTW